MNDFICSNCGKKLAELKLQEGKIEIKCSKCGTFNTIETKKEDKPKSAKSANG